MAESIDHTDRDHAPAGGAADDPRRRAPVLVLASASPRRRDLLARLGLDPILRPADLDERPLADESPRQLVERLARRKAAAGSSAAAIDEVVLGADTEVVLDGRALGKPVDAAHAARMLTELSDRTHEVLTGIAVRRGSMVTTAVVRTTVGFRALSPGEIDWYVATGEPFGKAGAYALQGAGAALVDRVDGSASNVVGLPLAEVVLLLREVGLDLLVS